MKSPKRTKTIRILALLLALILLSGCRNNPAPTPTIDVNALATTVFQTIEANNTETAVSNPTETPLPTGTPVPTETVKPTEGVVVLPIGPGSSVPTQDSSMIVNHYQDQIPTQAPLNPVLPAVPAASAPANIPAAIQPTATIPADRGDKASYQAQTPLDNVHVGRGEDFDITWYLMNTGTTTWSTEYSMRFYTGTNFTKPGKTRYYLTQPAAPNTIAALTIDARAPEEPGTYYMIYVLGNENDENFFNVDLTIIVD